MEPKYPPPPGFVPPPPYTAGPPPSHAGIQPPPVVYVQPAIFGPDSQRLTCPNCQASISTTVENEASSKTHLFAILLCVVGLWCCVPLPYCMDSCLVKKHYCPACNQYLGQYEI